VIFKKARHDLIKNKALCIVLIPSILSYNNGATLQTADVISTFVYRRRILAEGGTINRVIRRL